MSIFPRYRPRRLRRTEVLRRMVRETKLSVDDLIYPLFVIHGQGVKKEILSMPGSYHWSIDMLPAEVREIATLGIPAVILFGLPSVKDEVGSENYDEHGIVQQAIRTIKGAVPDLVVVTDICMCEYTSHGHCGIVRDGYVQNDETLEYLTKVAYSHAAAGADIVAPSGMIDGQVGAIREALDKNDYENMAIMSYAAKYASSFYGPFRDAALSPPKFGDRRSHQMDPPNAREALREVALDIEEGADIVMIKPALAYLDIIHRARNAFRVPLAAYNVSGEYSLVKELSRGDPEREQALGLEILTAIKRAGADIIITYYAKEAARWLSRE